MQLTAPLRRACASRGAVGRNEPKAPSKSIRVGWVARLALSKANQKPQRGKASIESKLDLHIITPSGECRVEERRRLVARARAARRQRCAREDQGAAAADARREPLAEHWCRQKGRPDRFGRKDDRGLGGVDRGLGSLLQYVRERSWD